MGFYDVLIVLALLVLSTIGAALVGPIVLLLARRRPGRFAWLLTGMGLIALICASLWLGLTLPDAMQAPNAHHDSDTFGESSSSHLETALWAAGLWWAALGGRWLGLRWRSGGWRAAVWRCTLDSLVAIVLVGLVAYAYVHR